MIPKIRAYAIKIQVGQEEGGTTMNATTMIVNWCEEEKVTKKSGTKPTQETKTTTTTTTKSNKQTTHTKETNITTTPTKTNMKETQLRTKEHTSTPSNSQTNTPQFPETKKCERWTVGTVDGLQQIMGYLSIGPGISIARKARPRMPAHLTTVNPTPNQDPNPNHPSLPPWLDPKTQNRTSHIHLWREMQ